ncbi:PLATZ transcription factor family protein isoform 2 [Hibiscus syriacus]|uniref:PLATZ transcription factor family protein isoform 2 n=1 Tax=Hibiscus syriacus TaxID=106335 RepID=A0A6A3BCI2_HIBSY|nr:PLATZ transcription factor family protein isoform 2 [Hibiscus syriacus]
MGAGGPDEEDNRWPPWLKPLLREQFFVQCKLHIDSHKSECNMYCLDCMNGSLCSCCLAYHRDHRYIQIRRSSYHDVIESRIQKYLDISGVQTYVINSAKVSSSMKGLNQGLEKVSSTLVMSVIEALWIPSAFALLIVGTSKNFQKKKRQMSMESESEDSYSSSSSHGKSNNNKVLSFSPSTPPPNSVNYRSGKRRKGIPHRAPMGGLIIQY